MSYIRIIIIIILFTLASFATRCCDGSYSSSSGRGTCSHHGGVCSNYSTMPRASFPKDINITCNTKYEITLNWENISDAYYYRVYYSYESNSSYFNYLGISFYDSEYITNIFETCNIYFQIKSCNRSYSCSDNSLAITPISNFNSTKKITDILWQKGKYYSFWYMKDDGTHTYKYIGKKDEPYKVVGTNDFNSDGVTDILWQKGKYYSFWYMKDDGTHTYKYIGKKDEPYKVVGTNDFNSDGVTDILWQKGKYYSLWYIKDDGTHTYKYIGKKDEPYKVVGKGNFD